MKLRTYFWRSKKWRLIRTDIYFFSTLLQWEFHLSFSTLYDIKTSFIIKYQVEQIIPILYFWSENFYSRTAHFFLGSELSSSNIHRSERFIYATKPVTSTKTDLISQILSMHSSIYALIYSHIYMYECHREPNCNWAYLYLAKNC